MGTKNQKGTVSVENVDGRIRLRWRFLNKRYSLNLFLFSKTNFLEARRIAVQIEQDIASDKFDTSLKSYKPVISKNVKPALERKSLVEHFEFWVKNYRNMNCETDVDYNSTRNMMRRWGKFDENSFITHFNQETFGAKTYNRRLTLLKAFFKWTTKSKITVENPLEDVLPRKTKKLPKSNRKPFTEEEISKVLSAFKHDTFSPKYSASKHSHYYPFIFFLFKTGIRNAEAVGLRVQHLDFEKSFVHIKEVLARSLKGTNAAARVRKETKNGKHRVIPLTDDLKAIIQPLIKGKKSDDLVFQSPSGTAIDDYMFQKRIFRKILTELGIEHRVLYACRHTFNSRCIEAGINPVTTAFLMGNNPETALRNYTHLISLPTELPKIG